MVGFDGQPENLESFILDKLIHVIGSPGAVITLADAKRIAGLDRVGTPTDVIAVGRVMARLGGFIGIVGDLLILEAGRWSTR